MTTRPGTIWRLATVCTLLGACAARPAGALQHAPGVDLALDTRPPVLSLRPHAVQPDAGADPGAPEAAAPVVAFAQEGWRHLSFGGGFADNFGDATDLNASVGLSYFFVDRVEAAIEVGLWHSNQDGDNVVGLNLTPVLRWHFYADERWTVYVDGGVGVLVASDEVPDGGTEINFTPRLGAGVTRLLNDRGWRLQAGVRWHHISNARIEGEARNPSRDAPMLYAALIVPW